MSMILELHTVSDANLIRVLADPPLVWKVVSPDDDGMYEAARAEAGVAEAGFFQRLFGRRAQRRRRWSFRWPRARSKPPMSTRPGTASTSC
jgi:hypothetical protein